MEPAERWWDDEEFQDRLTTLLVSDYKTLKDCAGLLTANDFNPVSGMKNGRSRRIIAGRALEYYSKYHKPIGSLLRADTLEYAEQISLGASHVGQLKLYMAYLSKIVPESADALVEKVVRFKGQRLIAASVQDLVDLLSTDQLTPEKWREVSAKALSATNGGVTTVSFLETVGDRNARRKREALHTRSIWTLIDPLDSMVKTVGPGELGLVLAPWKRGKSFFLLWLAVAYAIQRLKVLYVTLEDPRKRVEDRLDSIISGVPIKNLHIKPETLRKKIAAFGDMAQNIEIYDGTEGGTTWSKIEQIWLTLRDKGFIPDATIVDYDAEIRPARQYKEKRFELDEVYRDGRAFMAQYNQYGWTAAQTQRGTRTAKILTGDRIGEDITKIHKVSCALSLGKGDWTDNSYYLYVAAHKNDIMDVGCELVPDLSRALVYDRDATYAEAKNHVVDVI